MRSRLAGLSALLLAAVALAGCGGRGNSEPAGRVSTPSATVKLLYPQSVPITVTWEPARPLDRRHGRVVAFVHLVRTGERRNEVFRTFDHALPKAWIPGERQTDEIDLYQSALAEPLAPGRYVLSIGLYDESWGYRWPLATGPEIAKREYRLADVEVGGPDPTAPKFEFSGGWQPLETLQNKQVLSRRTFMGASRVSFESQAAGSLRMLASLPQTGGPDSVRVTASCAPDADQTITAGTSRWFFVDVVPGPCRIDFEPSPPVGPKSPVGPSLDVLSWRPR
jgi:hypothetical protein